MSDTASTTYTEKDFVDVVDEQGNELPPIPKRWLGTDLVPAGVVKADGKSAKSDKADDGEVKIPEGEPSEEWTGKQLDAYAAAKNVTFDKDVKNKAQKVEALAAAAAATPPPPPAE